jgi:hypothetical protein
MKTLRRFFRRLTSWATSARDEEFLRAEIEDHVAMQAAEYVRGGLSPEEARRQALLKFGSVEAIKDSYRDQRGLPLLETLARDTRHALRRFRKNPAFTAAVVLTLALGIGGNTAIFGVIESVLIRPLAYPNAEELVGVWHTAPGMSAADPLHSCSPSMYFTYREENRTFQHFGLWRFGVAPVTGAGEPELPRVLMVTHGVLALDVKPSLGRWFSQADDTPGSPETVILTHGYWRRRFLGDTSIIGRAMTINAQPHTVIGVMPEAFRFSRDRREPELILPLRFERSRVDLGTFAYRGIARLKSGITMAHANADLARMLAVWLQSWPSPPGFDSGVFRNARFGPQIQPLKLRELAAGMSAREARADLLEKALVLASRIRVPVAGPCCDAVVGRWPLGSRRLPGRALNLADPHWLLARSGVACRPDLHTDSPRQHKCLPEPKLARRASEGWLGVRDDFRNWLQLGLTARERT